MYVDRERGRRARSPCLCARPRAVATSAPARSPRDRDRGLRPSAPPPRPRMPHARRRSRSRGRRGRCDRRDRPACLPCLQSAIRPATFGSRAAARWSRAGGSSTSRAPLVDPSVSPEQRRGSCRGGRASAPSRSARPRRRESRRCAHAVLERELGLASTIRERDRLQHFEHHRALVLDPAVITIRSGGTISRYSPRERASSPFGPRMQRLEAPPGPEVELEQTAGYTSGPNQRSRRSSLDQASKTSSRGASNGRVSTTS